jgi:hypothetical protein
MRGFAVILSCCLFIMCGCDALSQIGQPQQCPEGRCPACTGCHFPAPHHVQPTDPNRPPTPFRPYRPNGSMESAGPEAQASAEDVKTGTYQCARCNKNVVGKDWKQLWTDKGANVQYMCQHCWEEATPAERVAIFDRLSPKWPLKPETIADLRSRLKESP